MSNPKVSLFVTCLVDQFFPQVGMATVQVLERLGVTVDFNKGQTCCGQPAFNSGFANEACKVVEHLLETYSSGETVVTPSGSCATMIKCFAPTLFSEGSPDWMAARQLANRTFEFSDYLVSVLGVKSTGARFSARVTFHDSCHQLRELGIRNQPRTLIQNVEGIEFVELKDSQRCCGFGGTFAVKFSEVSTAIGQDKVNSIRDSGAEFVISNDVSCLMHIGGLLKRQKLPIKTMHLAELLAQ